MPANQRQGVIELRKCVRFIYEQLAHLTDQSRSICRRLSQGAGHLKAHNRKGEFVGSWVQLLEPVYLNVSGIPVDGLDFDALPIG